MLSKYQREIGTENPYFLVVVRLLLICYCLLFTCGIVSVTVLLENVPGTREPFTHCSSLMYVQHGRLYPSIAK